MARGRCESRPRRRPSAGKTERSLKGAFLLTDTPEADARAARLELERLLVGASLDLPPGFADAAERYVALLLAANRRLNLTRVTDPQAVARLHLLDALSALPLVDGLRDDGSAVLDLGSGGGVPGLVLALARPHRRWVLVDSVRKKAEALRSFVGSLGITNVDVVAERAEILGRDPAHREVYGAITARACAALPVLVEYALPLLAGGGTLLAWKGAIADDELRAGRAAASACGGGEPSVRAAGFAELGDHRFVLVAKVRPTPATYPRRPGQPSRSPLGSA
jgi:16S rRNA (guanine527-N7)-methyltransferase